jgi:inhibitor of cysteine peptidase
VTVGPDATGINFSGALRTYTVSGVVTSGGAGLGGVTLSAGGRTAITASTGAYTISGLPAGTYTLTPTKSGYAFTPASRSITITSANLTGQNFAGARALAPGTD